MNRSLQTSPASQIVRDVAKIHRDGPALEEALKVHFPDATVLRASVTPLYGERRLFNVTISGPNLSLACDFQLG